MQSWMMKWTGYSWRKSKAIYELKKTSQRLSHLQPNNMKASRFDNDPFRNENKHLETPYVLCVSWLKQTKYQKHRRKLNRSNERKLLWLSYAIVKHGSFTRPDRSILTAKGRHASSIFTNRGLCRVINLSNPLPFKRPRSWALPALQLTNTHNPEQLLDSKGTCTHQTITGVGILMLRTNEGQRNWHFKIRSRHYCNKRGKPQSH